MFGLGLLVPVKFELYLLHGSRREGKLAQAEVVVVVVEVGADIIVG